MKKTFSLLLAVLMLAAMAAMAVPASAKALPTGYMELEYVETDGTQYIDTGIYATSKSGLDITFQILDPYYPGKGTSAGICGIYYGGSTKTSRFQIAYSRTQEYITMGMGNLLVNTPDVIPKDTEKHTAKFDAVAGTFVFDDRQIAQMDPVEIAFDDAEDKRVNFLIGATNFSKSVDAVTSYSVGATRIFGVTFYDDGAPIAEFVPALRIEDNMVGMYDIIRDKFFENALYEGVSFNADPAVVTTEEETTKEPAPVTDPVTEPVTEPVTAPIVEADIDSGAASTDAPAPGTQDAGTQKTDTDDKKSGCGSSAAALSVLLTAALGCAFVRRKEN